MESSSSGRFYDYSDPKPPATPRQSTGDAQGGTSGEDIDACKVPLPNVRLEEISRSEYFSSKKNVPGPDTNVQVRKDLVGGRIAVETIRGNQSVGFLPTQYNYLAGCLKSGNKYKGKITASSNLPSPRIVVDLFPV